MHPAMNNGQTVVDKKEQQSTLSDIKPSPAKENSSIPMSSQASTQAIASIGSYCLANMVMTVTNKYVFSGAEFNLHLMLLGCQSLVCLFSLLVAKNARLISFRDFNAEEARKWSPISFLLVLMIFTSAKALQYISIPTYTIFKNLTIILIAYGEVLWFGGSVTTLALSGFGLMVLSSVVSAWADISATIHNYAIAPHEAATELASLNAGYIWMLLNCLSSATFVLSMRKRIKLTNFSDFDTMFYNNLLSIPILIVASFAFEDWGAANLEQNFPADHRQSLLLAILVSGFSSVFISYCTAWCLRVTSSTTYSMAGALNKLPVAISGMIFFDAPVTFFSVTAVMIGFAAGIVYAIAKQLQKKQEKLVLPVTNVPARPPSRGNFLDHGKNGSAEGLVRTPSRTTFLDGEKAR